MMPVWNWNPKKVLLLFLISITVSVLFFTLRNKPPKAFWTDADFRQEDEYHHLWFDRKEVKNNLDGLLAEGFDEKSCRSRYQSGWYHKGLMRKPAPYLISRLRSYEALHKRCAPSTEAYKRALSCLNATYLQSVGFNSSTGCKYVVWTPRDGLGNRIITLASTFLYALLTNRVMLVDDRDRVSDLFCEPFPEGSSWLAAGDFPLLEKSGSFRRDYDMSYGNLLKKNNGSVGKNGWVYLHVAHDYDEDDQRLFCDDHEQTGLQDVPWHVLKSNVYFVPSLFLIPSFQEELNRLFPEKEAVFHLLGRYLLHPTNGVWRAVSNYYNHFLAKADDKIGIQVRIFDTELDPFEHYKDQILKCVHKENLLPLPASQMKQLTANSLGQSKAVLVTSLSPRYYQALKKTYSDNSTIRFFQPTGEFRQNTTDEMQNMKAWGEMYLLSLMDELVTSSKSTFGYVSQGLGGLKPWILYRPSKYRGDPDPPCERARSMEPCFQAPPSYDCRTGKQADLGRILPYIRHCEDMQWTWGLKLYGKDGES